MSVGGGADTALAVRCVTSPYAPPPVAAGPRLSARDAVLPVARYATALAHALAGEGAPAARIEVDALARRCRGPGGEAAALVGLVVRVTGSGSNFNPNPNPNPNPAADTLRATARRLAAEWVAGGALPSGMDARVFSCSRRTETSAVRPAAPRPVPVPPGVAAVVRRPRHSGRPRRVLALVVLGAAVAVGLAVARPFVGALGVDGSPRVAAGEATRPAKPPPTAVSGPRVVAPVAAQDEAPTVAATSAATPTGAPAPVASATPEPSPVAADQAAGAPPDIGTADPVQTVRSLYRLLGQSDYDRLPGLLSGRLRDTLSWQPDALRQRIPSGSLTVERAELVSQDADGRLATVAVQVRETLWPGSDRSRTYVGTWQLVRGPSGWLLDGSDLQIMDDRGASGG